MTAKFYLNVAGLRRHDACETGIDKFVHVFGTGKVMLTDKNYKRAVEARLPIWWFAIKYLPFDVFMEADKDFFQFSYETQAQRYWDAIKAHMATDDTPRPDEWY